MKSFCQWAGKEVGKRGAKGRVHKTGKSAKEMQTCPKLLTGWKPLRISCKMNVKAILHHSPEYLCKEYCTGNGTFGKNVFRFKNYTLNLNGFLFTYFAILFCK